MAHPLNTINSTTENIPTEQQVVDISVQSFLSACRVKPQINDDDYSKNEEQLLFEKNWQQVLYVTSLTPIYEYLTDLLDFSTLNSSFCCRVESLFYLKMFDELSSLINSLLVAIEQKHPTLSSETGINNSNNSDNLEDNLAPSPQSPKPLSIPSNNNDSNNNNTNNNYNCHHAYLLEDCSIVLRLLSLEVKVMTGQGDESLQQLHVLEMLLQASIHREDTAPSTSATTSSTTNGIANMSPHAINTKNNLAPPHKPNLHQQWLYVVKSIKINVLIRQHQLQTAASELLKIIQLPLFHQDQSSQIVLLCFLARLCIQIGAIKAADQYYRKAYLLFDSSPLKDRAQATEIIMSGNSSPENDVYDLVLMTRGLIQFALNQYEEAMSTFNTIVDRYKQHHLLLATTDMNLDPPSIDIASSKQNINYYKKSYPISAVNSRNNDHKNRRQNVNNNNSQTLGSTAMNVYFFSMSDFSDSILTITVNNISVCALFVKQMNHAILNLESLIQLDPCEYIINSIVFNLCTLYDLSLTTEQSSVKKKCLFTIAQLYNVSDVTVPYQSFRL